jgi:hypothetical protein
LKYCWTGVNDELHLTKEMLEIIVDMW